MASGAAAELFQLSVKDLPVENGKKLEMKFEEVERHAEHLASESLSTATEWRQSGSRSNNHNTST